MGGELRDPPHGPIWPSPSEIYLARHTYREMTNVVFELRNPQTQTQETVVVSLDTNQLLDLTEVLSQRLDVVLQILAEDQAIDDLTW